LSRSFFFFLREHGRCGRGGKLPHIRFHDLRHGHATQLCGKREEIDEEEEIASHLAMAIRDRIDRGETPADARRRAAIEFGNPVLAKETTRSVWTWTACEQLIAGAQIGARIL
jgi:integrase